MTLKTTGTPIFPPPRHFAPGLWQSKCPAMVCIRNKGNHWLAEISKFISNLQDPLFEEVVQIAKRHEQKLQATNSIQQRPTLHFTKWNKQIPTIQLNNWTQERLKQFDTSQQQCSQTENNQVQN